MSDHSALAFDARLALHAWHLVAKALKAMGCEQ